MRYYLSYVTGLGETLLYRRLPEALDYIHEKTTNVHTFISTNAHLPRISQLVAPISDKLSTIQISMDGVGDIYDTVRVKGDYGTFIGNVKTIVAMSKASIQFNMVVFEQNYKQMADVVKVAHEVGVAHVHFNTMNLVTMPSLDRTGYDLYATDGFLDEYQRARNVARDLGVRMTSFDFEGRPGFQKCVFPWEGFYVSWDGYLVPCCAKPFPLEKNFGNVFRDGLMACLNSPEYRKFRRQWYANETPSFCEGCHLIDTPRIADARVSWSGREGAQGEEAQTRSGAE
jgi:MoaA/NifB/PqqE/SkfB family radical SAM enzyme